MDERGGGGGDICISMCIRCYKKCAEAPARTIKDFNGIFSLLRPLRSAVLLL